MREGCLSCSRICSAGLSRVAVDRSARSLVVRLCLFFFQAEDGIRDLTVTGVQTCALPIFSNIVPSPSFLFLCLRRPDSFAVAGTLVSRRAAVPNAALAHPKGPFRGQHHRLDRKSVV